MSTLEEKLEQDRGSSGKARRKLSSLMGKGGFRIERQDKQGPTLVSVCPMVERTYWRRVHLDGKKDAVMELERTETDGGQESESAKG